MAYKYRPADEKTVKERATQQGGAFDSYTDPSFPTFRPAKGKHSIRLLPPSSQIDTEKWGDTFSIHLWIHYSVGTDKSAYLCLEKNKDETCPLCEARAEQNSERDDDDKDDPLKPGKRALAWIIDRDNEKDGPLLWAMPWTVDRDINALRLDKQLGIIAIDEPDNGYDVDFTVEGEKITTKYVGMRIAREESPLSDNIKRQDKWLAFVEDNPLPDTLKYFDPEYLDKVYRGKLSRKEDDNDNETSSRKKDTRRGRDDEDDNKRDRKRRDEDDSEEDGDNRSSRSSRSRADKDDESGDDTRAGKRTRREEVKEDEDDKRSSRRSRDDEDDSKDRTAKRSTRPSSRRERDDEDDNKDTKKPKNEEAKDRISSLNKKRGREEDDDNKEENEEDEDDKRSSRRSRDDDGEDDNSSRRSRGSSSRRSRDDD